LKKITTEAEAEEAVAEEVVVVAEEVAAAAVAEEVAAAEAVAAVKVFDSEFYNFTMKKMVEKAGKKIIRKFNWEFNL